MNPTIDIELRRPTARFASVAVLVGAIALAVLLIPGSIKNLPPQIRMLPEATQRALLVVLPWALLLFAALLGGLAVRVARSNSFRIIVIDDRLRFPLRSGAQQEILLSELGSIGCNTAGDHVVIMARGKRHLLPWYFMPHGRTPMQVAQELAAALFVKS